MTQKIAFTSTGLGCHPETNYYTTQCTPNNGYSPSCDCLIETVPGTSTYFQGAPNWGGHGAGIWMYGRGPAANTLGTGSSQVSHTYVATGNGGFQVYSGSSAYNLGSSILDFQMSAGGVAGASGTSPTQSFTPYGGAAYSPPLAATAFFPNFPGTVCNGPGTCSYTFQSMNENDWDMGPITLFTDTINNKNWLVSVDKSGYGYLLPQGNLCNSASGPCQAFASGDGPNWPFLAAFTPCWNISGGASDCDKIGSLSFFSNNLYFWPTKERLTALAMSDNSTTYTGAGSVYVFSANPYVINGCNGTGCPANCAGGGTCFTDEVIPGDTVTIGGQSATVVSVVNDATMAVNTALSPASGASFTYSGYFVNPARDFNPPGSSVDYPGGSLVITANAGSNGIVWSLTTTGAYPSEVASLYAYNATPVITGNARNLQKLWNSTDSTFALNANANNLPGATFALPTVVNGAVYIPTYSITPSGGGTVSGVLVYCGTGAPACN